MLKNIKENFNPLLFLAALGAGGIAVSAFVVIQYTGLFAGEGLATFSTVNQSLLTIILEIIMAGFGLLHLFLIVIFFMGYFSWRKTDSFKVYLENPLVNSGLMAPLLSLAMFMNVIIAVVRYYVPVLSDNFQAIMAPAFVVYLILWIFTMFAVLTLLKKSFINTFDVDKIHFGWLLQPFALAMITVTGTGFAALAHNTSNIEHNLLISNSASFLALISGTMAVFLTWVKISSIFKKHLHRSDSLEHQFMPTYLIVVPIITLFAISVFRLGMFVTHHGTTTPVILTMAKITLLVLFAFQIWYFIFGLMMLKGYWGGYLRNKFHLSQWGLVCPFVAMVTLLAFVQYLFIKKEFIVYIIFTGLIGTIALYVFLLKRQYICLKSNVNSICDK